MNASAGSNAGCPMRVARPLTCAVWFFGLLGVALPGLSARQQSGSRETNRKGATVARGVARTEFVFDTAPFASAHASTIVETREDGVLGPIKNKLVRLSDGTLVAPSSTESAERPSTWRVHFERTTDAGLTWKTAFPSASADGNAINAIQPSILVHPDGKLQALGRTRSQRVFETWSGDGGRTWDPISLTSLPNPNSGIDAVTLRDGRHIIVYNHTIEGRSPLNVSVSRDGNTWDAALVLENAPGEYSYPAVIQSSDGRVHITYTWKRERIKHVVIDTTQLPSITMPDGNWPQAFR